jgi:hypothetical protein
MLCDNEWYDKVDKVCKAVELNIVRSASCMLPHIKVLMLLALALAESITRPRVVTMRYIFICACLCWVKFCLCGGRALMIHFALLYVYTSGPLGLILLPLIPCVRRIVFPYWLLLLYLSADSKTLLWGLRSLDGGLRSLERIIDLDES